MTFRPFVIGEGLPAWTLLKSTLTTQKSVFNASYVTQSDTGYFRESFGALNTAEDIVSDRRILRVILGAYGLSDDIDNRHFIKTVLNEGVADQSALANKLSDRRYRLLAKDFDFSTFPPAHKLNVGLLDRTIANFQAQSFEIEIGKVNADMRLALGFPRALAEVAQSAGSNSTAWFQVLATPPLREVLQTALGLPKEFAQLDIDDQHERIMEKASRVFGTDVIADLVSNTITEQITRRFLVLRQSEAFSQSSSLQTALVLLSSIPQRPKVV